MIPRPPLLTLLASLIVHGGALAILFFVASGESHSSVLFVDLEAVSERELAAAVSERKRPAAEGDLRRARAGSARPIERDAGRPAPASSPAPSPAAPPSTVTPAPSPEPVREREVTPTTPPEPRQPEPAVAAVPAREDASDGVARSSASASSVDARKDASNAAERTGSVSDAPIGRGTTQGPGTPGESPGGAGVGVALAPSGPPGGGAPGAEYGGYLANVRRLIQETLRYPAPARRRGLKGTVYLEIFIKSDGAISAVSIAGSSSHPLLDEAALEAVRSLAPQPFPKGLAPRPLRVRLPVVFDLQ